MSAEAIIDQIKALPPGERAKVIEYVQQNPLPTDVRYLSDEKFNESLDRVFTEHRELMRLLSQ
jgi:hypothetical protein